MNNSDICFINLGIFLKTGFKDIGQKGGDGEGGEPDIKLNFVVCMCEVGT